MSVVAPAVPQNYLCQQANAQVFLSWNQVQGTTAYSVQRSIDQGRTYTVVASPTTPYYLDTTVTPNTSYMYQVASVNSAATSPYTIPQEVTPVLSGKMTLGQLRLQSQFRADRVNSNFVTTPEWNTYINQALFELYDLLVQKYGNEYFVAQEAIFSTTGAQMYPLPDGVTVFQNKSNQNIVAKPFYKLLGVDLFINGTANSTAAITLKKFEFISRNRYIYPQITTNLLGIAGLRYRLVDNQLMFIPSPSAGQQVGIWYIPRLTALLQDTDVADGVSGWLEYVIVRAAKYALDKEESDTTKLDQELQFLNQRIEAAAENRDAGEPETISNTRRDTDLYGNGSGGYDGPSGGY